MNTHNTKVSTRDPLSGTRKAANRKIGSGAIGDNRRQQRQLTGDSAAAEGISAATGAAALSLSWSDISMSAVVDSVVGTSGSEAVLDPPPQPPTQPA